MTHGYRTGVIIGKFYPTHNGHHHLIRQASPQCEHLSVILCWKPEESVPADVRSACLREMHPEIEVIEVDYDGLADDDTQGWAEYTLRILGYVPEAVFTSEDYGEAYARAMGTTHVMVDRDRTAVPCSGTMIRKNPLDCLSYLSPPMRAYYVRRVCVLGAESTGTTTLAHAVAEHFRTVWVPEYGREYCEIKWKDGYTDHWTTNEFVHIAQEQSKREDAAARVANKVLVCDTDPLATSIWHLRYVGHRSAELEQLARARHYDLYILTGDEIPFDQDGFRDGQHIRHWMHETFVRELEASGQKWALATGSHEERMAQAVSLINPLLGPALNGDSSA